MSQVGKADVLLVVYGFPLLQFVTLQKEGGKERGSALSNE
jgi:hypothetical protein